MQQTAHSKNREAGFSLMELLVAMAVMIIITGAATTMLVGAFNVRSREDQRTEGISDTRRALNTLSRELANAGYRLPTDLTYTSSSGSSIVPTNGLLPDDCNAQSIAFVADLDANEDVGDINEALKYQFFQNDGSNFLVRNDLNPAGGSIVLANRIDGAQFDYLDAADNPVAVAAAVRVRITVMVTLNEVGKSGSAGYQPPSQVRLASVVNLRNATLNTF